MSLIQLAFKSILSRKLVVILLTISIGLSTMLLIGVQKIKESARSSFSHSISGTDLIVGARTGDIQLLMYTVFHVGKPVSNVSWNTVNRIKAHPQVDWIIPISLGDSHNRYSVVGTTSDYFKHFKYGRKKNLSYQKGKPFNALFDVVIGSEVAQNLNYQIGDTIYLSHGTNKSASRRHDNKRFTIQGILNHTGTPVDKSLFVSLESIEALHIDWKNGVAPLSKNSLGNDQINTLSLTPKSVTGCFLGLKSKLSVFSVQRQLIDKFNEPLSAIIPGVSLAQLWKSISTIDSAFFIITLLVILVAFIGLVLALFMSLNQRQKELALLRSMGCHPIQIFLLLTFESLIITCTGVLLGMTLLISSGYFITPFLEAKMGLVLSLTSLTHQELLLALSIILFGLIVSAIPAFQAYRKSISDSLLVS